MLVLWPEGEVWDKLQRNVKHSLSCNKSLRGIPGPHETTEVAVKPHMASLKGAWSELSVAWSAKGKTGFGQSRYRFKCQLGQAEASPRF